MIDIETQTLTLKTGKKINLNNVTFLDAYPEDYGKEKSTWCVDICVKGARFTLKYDNVKEVLELTQAITKIKRDFNRLKLYWLDKQYDKIMAE
jgi:hypothetical protein